MKKIFTLIAAMLLVPWVGWGQEETIKISTAEELRAFAKNVNENTNDISWNVTLENNIDLGGESNPWTPIEEFSGTFDGKGNTITGLFIKGNSDETEKNSYGLFGCPRQGATIQNVKIEEGYICYTGNSHVYIGGIVAGGNGVCGNLKINNCSFDGLIDVTIDSYAIGMNAIGGILGGFESNGPIISSCCYKGKIKVSLKGLKDTYGYASYAICGIGKGNEILNSYNEGDISVEVENVTAMQIQVCGISDALEKISSCYNTGDITVNTVEDKASTITSLSVGGITGANLYNAIEYCYNTGEISSNIESAKIGSIIGSDNSEMTYIKNYYLEGDGNTAIGAASEGEASSEELISASTEQFQDGTVAYELRKSGAKYGQKLNAPDSESSPVLLVFKENEGKEVYKLNLDYSLYDDNKEAVSDYVNSKNLCLPSLEPGAGWYNSKEETGKLYTSTSEISDDITLYAKKQTLHNITIEATEGGSVSADKKQAIVGETITLTVTPEEGYALESISATTKDGQSIDIVNNSFTMPDADVTVSAKFTEKLYTVTIEYCVGGTATIDGESSKQFAAKATVALSIKADEGYKFSHIVYTYDGENKTSEQTTFPMPASDVTVKVFFVAGDDEEGDGAGTTLKRYRLYLADQDFYLNDEYDEAGLVLFSRHDKKYTDVGGSFTIWFEKNGEVNEGARVFISNRANGEYKEVKLDEVSGYYQIRNVQSNIYVKLYTEEGFPVANESIEATDARAYAQPNKIVVITPEPTEVQIISMAGAVVATAQVAGQQEFANLAEGVYIVRMGKEIIKLQVRN